MRESPPSLSLVLQAHELSQEVLGTREVEHVDIVTDQFSNGEAHPDLVGGGFVWLAGR